MSKSLMPEFEPFPNSFGSLPLLICSGSLGLAVSYIGLVVAMLIGFFEYLIQCLYRLYRARISLAIACALLEGWGSTVLGCGDWDSAVLVHNCRGSMILGCDGSRLTFTGAVVQNAVSSSPFAIHEMT